MQIYKDVLKAHERIASHVRKTPVDRALSLEENFESEVYLKLENVQVTGSFKVRGAMNRALCIPPQEQAAGIVAASTGNHGAGVAFAARTLGIPGVVYVPETASPEKVAAISRLGAEVRYHGDDCVITELEARRYANSTGSVYISPYNDEQVVAGQGTIGHELLQQIDELDTVFVAMGGGGLISGIAGYLAHASPKTRVIACSPANSCVMHQSLQAGQLLDLPSEPTLSDSTAGGVEAGSVTFGLCQSYVSDSITVTEEEIIGATRRIITEQHLLVEGAAGVAVAGYLTNQERHRGQRVGIILCGANIPLAKLKTILG